MTTGAQRTARRRDALSTEQIIAAAIEILDAEGERALTFRALAARLATGSGAIYHYVSGKDQLLAAAADGVVARVTTGVDDEAGPREGIRDLAVGIFDAIADHPWVGAQLSAEPWQPAVLRIFDGVGTRLARLGVPDAAQFDQASVVVYYILGLAGQYAAAARLLPADTDQSAFLGTIAAQWVRSDRADYPFVHRAAAALPEHDDREQFLTGIDLILAGIEAAR